MTRQTDEVEDALRQQAIDHELLDLRKHVLKLESSVTALREERDSMMRWGLITLGAAVVGMGLYIWNLFSAGGGR